jgi:hypothetical protein
MAKFVKRKLILILQLFPLILSACRFSRRLCLVQVSALPLGTSFCIHRSSQLGLFADLAHLHFVIHSLCTEVVLCGCFGVAV